VDSEVMGQGGGERQGEGALAAAGARVASQLVAAAMATVENGQVYVP
jgi:hypothetical protein